MATEVMDKPLQYLDKAVTAIRDLGIWPESSAEQPITGGAVGLGFVREGENHSLNSRLATQPFAAEQ